MISKHYFTKPILVTIIALGWPATVAAQESRPALYVSIGTFHHTSDLHLYYDTRFDDAIAVGAGIALPLHRLISARVIVEHVSTQLSGGPTFARANRGSDNILAAEIQLIGAANITDRLRPYVGAGVGLRRYVLNSAVLADDIIEWPWSEPQLQPAFSAIAGVTVSLSPKIGVAAEARWSRARFRAGEDSWGLPEGPLAWQHEFRPAIRLALSPW